jgi:hypothetical protein
MKTMGDKEWGMLIGGIMGAPTLGYIYGARKLLTFIAALMACVWFICWHFDIKPPPPLEPPKCLRYEVKTYSVMVQLYPTVFMEMTGPVCMEWAPRK